MNLTFIKFCWPGANTFVYKKCLLHVTNKLKAFRQERKNVSSSLEVEFMRSTNAMHMY